MNTFSQVDPILMTNDMAAKKSFWCDVFGFTCDGEMIGLWMSLTRDKTTVMSNVPYAHAVGIQEHVFTGSIDFTVGDADALWSELIHKTKVCYPINTFDYGMHEFGVYHNNEYRFQFGHDLQS